MSENWWWKLWLKRKTTTTTTCSIILRLPIPLTLKCIHAAEIYDLWKAARAAKAERLKVKRFLWISHKPFIAYTIWVPYLLLVYVSHLWSNEECFFLNEGLQLRNYFIIFNKFKKNWVANPPLKDSHIS